jgi:hypothetical protein
LLSQYPTSTPIRLFAGTAAVGVFLLGAVSLGLLTLLFGLAYSFGSRAFGEDQLPTWFAMPANYNRDAFWIGLGGSALLITVRRLLDFVSAWWPTVHRELPASFGNAFDAIFPGAALTGGAVFHGLMEVAVVALAAAFIGAELRARWLRLLLFLGTPACLVSNWGSPADFLKQFLGGLIVFGVVVFGIRQVVRFNILGIFLVACCTTLLGGAAEFLGQPGAFYRYNGYLLMLALIVLLGWPLVSWRLRSNATQA